MPKLKQGHLRPTPEEDQEIARGIAADPDAFDMSSLPMRRASEVLPAALYQELLKHPRGRPVGSVGPK